MSAQRSTALTLSFLAFLHAGEAIAQPLCRPEIAIKSVHFSEMVNLKRFWTATVNVDASRCAASSGLFALGFIRLSETAPDLEFSEPFFWHAGKMDVRVEFWADEAVERYWIAEVSPCPCRAR
jgi:hypothetical protein